MYKASLEHENTEGVKSADNQAPITKASSRTFYANPSTTPPPNFSDFLAKMVENYKREVNMVHPGLVNTYTRSDDVVRLTRNSLAVIEICKQMDASRLGLATRALFVCCLLRPLFEEFSRGHRDGNDLGAQYALAFPDCDYEVLESNCPEAVDDRITEAQARVMGGTKTETVVVGGGPNGSRVGLLTVRRALPPLVGAFMLALLNDTPDEARHEFCLAAVALVEHGNDRSDDRDEDRNWLEFKCVEEWIVEHYHMTARAATTATSAASADPKAPAHDISKVLQGLRDEHGRDTDKYKLALLAPLVADALGGLSLSELNALVVLPLRVGRDVDLDAGALAGLFKSVEIFE